MSARRNKRGPRFRLPANDATGLALTQPCGRWVVVCKPCRGWLVFSGWNTAVAEARAA